MTVFYPNMSYNEVYNIPNEVYNIPPYNSVLDKTRSCRGFQIFLPSIFTKEL